MTREKFLERVNKMFPIKTDDWNRYLDSIFEWISNDKAPLYESKMNAYLNETVAKYLYPSDDYVSLTEIAKKYDAANPSYLIQSWLRSRSTVELLATWERKYNSNFNEDAFQRITVDAKTPQFTLTSKKWIDLTNAIGVISKQGKSGGTMAHPFIACDFEMWNDAEFRFEVVKFFTSSEMEIFDSDNAE